MKQITTITLIIVGLINLLPIVGVASGATLAKLYGIDEPSGDLLILLRHRALMLGLVGGMLICAALVPQLQPAAMVIGLLSMLGFVALTFGVGEAGAAINRVAWIDILASIGLVAVALLNQLSKSPAAANRR